MNETIEKLKTATLQRRIGETTKLLDMMIEAKRELDLLDRQKGLIIESAFERISEFAVERMSKKDLQSLSKLYRELSPEFQVWLDKIRDIYEMTTGTKLEDVENG